jgi:hypothetical protein
MHEEQHFPRPTHTTRFAAILLRLEKTLKSYQLIFCFPRPRLALTWIELSDRRKLSVDSTVVLYKKVPEMLILNFHLAFV